MPSLRTCSWLTLPPRKKYEALEAITDAARMSSIRREAGSGWPALEL